MALNGHSSGFLPKPKRKLKQISKRQLNRIKKLNVTIYSGLPKETISQQVIDAYLGYNYQKRDDCVTTQVFDYLSLQHQTIFLDIPSGVDATTRDRESDISLLIILSLAFIKLGLLKLDQPSLGELYIGDIGVPKSIIEKKLNLNWYDSKYSRQALDNLYQEFETEVSIAKVKLTEESRWSV